jgi:hypothetical protein
MRLDSCLNQYLFQEGYWPGMSLAVKGNHAIKYYLLNEEYSIISDFL